MNPAPSIVFFTTASGAGYGLLFWLGVLAPFGLGPVGSRAALVAWGLALLLITAGLLSSLLHLGNPQRAWRAVSQWRTSWLSREGVAALLTYAPAGVLGVSLLLGWRGVAAASGLLAAAGAVATVYCTAMIYASLKPIREWRHPLVVPNYLLLSGFSGAALLAMLGGFAGAGWAAPTLAALHVGVAAALLKLAYWRAIDAGLAGPTIESATTLGWLGRVRPLDPPHTGTNYLLREMGYRVARKHARALRRLALGAGFAGPIALMALALFVGGGLAGVALGAAALLVLGGLLVERWLMFAEATHTVTLYYGGC